MSEISRSALSIHGVKCTDKQNRGKYAMGMIVLSWKRTEVKLSISQSYGFVNKLTDD